MIVGVRRLVIVDWFYIEGLGMVRGCGALMCIVVGGLVVVCVVGRLVVDVWMVGYWCVCVCLVVWWWMITGNCWRW